MADESGVFLRNLSPDRVPFVERYGLRPSDLGLPPTLAGQLEQWRDDRPGLGPEEAAARISWQRRGLELALLLQKELDHLGYDADVVYEDNGGLRPMRPGGHLAHRQDTATPELLVMADYGCFVWTNSPQLWRFRNEDHALDLIRLGASPGLVERLTAWHREWEDTNYGGWPVEDEDSWDRRGVQLAGQLQDELGTAVEVWFSGDGEGGIGRPVWELARD